MSVELALCGNPNCGKTTLFNLYTGANQYVGNWSGVTVEKKTGTLHRGEVEVRLIDLPGIYSLSPYSPEEWITREYILEQQPDVLLNVLDGTNMERNLYLTLQLLELGRPVLVAVGMMDTVYSQGGDIDCDRLAQLLGAPVVPVSAKRGWNTELLLEQAVRLAKNPQVRYNIRYDNATEEALALVSAVCAEQPDNRKSPLRFFAGAVLEYSEEVPGLLLDKPQQETISAIAEEYAVSGASQPETRLAGARYALAEKLCRRCVTLGSGGGGRSRRVDDLLLDRVLALPIFLCIMCIMFLSVFGPWGQAMKRGAEYLITDVLAGGLTLLLGRLSAPDWLYGLMVDAVLGGVGSVISFTPQIVLLFFFLCLLEDSGYMARAAFLVDRLLRGMGLPGKAFIPMLMGFGCTTPAVMAARTLENEKDRRLTIMLTPFMSCGARLPIYALFGSIFFSRWQGLVVFGMYCLGVLTAAVVGFFLRRTLFRGDDAPSVMELPPYRLPTVSTLCRHVWDRTKGFVVKAGTLIFLMSILVWLLQNFNFRLEYVTDSSQSVFAGMGRLLAPLFRPLGFDSWQASVSVLAGLVAKETVVSTLVVLGGDGGVQALFTARSALSFMVFCLLYMPCVSAFACVRREMNSTLWAVGAAMMQTAMAYLVALLCYQISGLFL